MWRASFAHRINVSATGTAMRMCNSKCSESKRRPNRFVAWPPMTDGGHRFGAQRPHEFLANDEQSPNVGRAMYGRRQRRNGRGAKTVTPPVEGVTRRARLG